MDRVVDQEEALAAAVASRRALLAARKQYEVDVLRAREVGVTVRKLASALGLEIGSIQNVERKAKRA